MIKNKQGFTLIELLVVITIIGLLSTLAVFSLNAARMKARDAKRMSDLKMISDTLEVYNIDNGKYPIDANDSMGIGCGDGGIMSLNGIICSGEILGNDMGTEIYMNPIPMSPQVDSMDFYYYAKDYAGYGYDLPCVWTEHLEKGNDIYFWCWGGHCQEYDGTNFCSYAE